MKALLLASLLVLTHHVPEDLATAKSGDVYCRNPQTLEQLKQAVDAGAFSTKEDLITFIGKNKCALFTPRLFKIQEETETQYKIQFLDTKDYSSWYVIRDDNIVRFRDVSH